MQIKLIIGAIVAVLAAFGIIGVYLHIANLKYELAKSTELLTSCKNDVQNAVSANNSNLLVISELRQDKKIADDLLEKSRVAIASMTSRRASDIKRIKEAPPSADGPVADVLSETITKINQERTK